MRPRCRPITEAEELEQHRLYMAANSPSGAKPIDVGGLLFCDIHRRPLIECHDDRGFPHG